MRMVNYEVKMKNGFDFITTNYAEATEPGSRIIKTFLTEPDTTPKKHLDWMAWHRKQIKKKFKF